MMFKVLANSWTDPVLDYSSAQSIGDSYRRYIETRPIFLPPSINHLIKAQLEADAALPSDVKVMNLIHLIYREFTPLSVYTRITDNEHFRRVYDNLRIVLEQKSLQPDQTALGIAAMGHDLERFLDHDGFNNPEKAYGVAKLDTLVPDTHPNFKAIRDELKKLDESLRKLVIHPIASMRLVDYLMRLCEIDDMTRLKVSILIRYHDTPTKTISADMIQSEFPGTPFGFKALISEISILGRADAMVFFQTPTVRLFLLERIGKTNDSELVSRLANNLKKMHPLEKWSFEQGLDSIAGFSPRGSNDSGYGLELDAEKETPETTKMIELLTLAYEQVLNG